MKRRRFLQATALSTIFSITTAKPAQLFEYSPAPSPNTLVAGKNDFFYRPLNAWAADFIPLYANGEFQLFYLLDWRDNEKHGEGTPWFRISTKDFVHFTDHGQMLPRGTVAEQDLYVFTGSAIKAKDQYHIFYTGHNPHLRAQGKPEQGVMHALSNDMITWTKLPKQTFYAPTEIYEKDDWRDPFVFWNEERGEYHMLLAARFKTGIPRRKGLTAMCSSKDLVNWEVRQPFYAPNLYFTHECPDLFRMGDWWYLLFSEFTDKVRTRYRMSHSIDGPWLSPEQDTFDGHAFYAAKTASDGQLRFIFGWNPTRTGEKDNGTWNWGGNLVVHEINQEPGGNLTVKLPQTVAAAFSKFQPVNFISGSGRYAFSNKVLDIAASGSFGAATAGKLPDRCKISAKASFEPGTKDFGLMFRTSDDFDKSYYIRLDPTRNKLVFDMWPRDRAEVSEMVELEREIKLIPKTPVTIQFLYEQNKGVVYVNDQIAMNFRAYDLPEGNWGFFVTDGTAQFTDITLSTIS